MSKITEEVSDACMHMKHFVRQVVLVLGCNSYFSIHVTQLEKSKTFCGTRTRRPEMLTTPLSSVVKQHLLNWFAHFGFHKDFLKAVRTENV